MSDDDVPAAIHDAERLAAVRATGLLDTPPEEGFDRLARLAAQIVDAPYAFITLVDERRSFWKSAVGLEIDKPEDRENPVHESFCQYVVETSEPLIAGDTASHPRTRENVSIEKMGVAAWAGFPLLGPEGRPLGSFCVVDTTPREWTDADVETLRTLSLAAASEVALRQAVATAAEINDGILDGVVRSMEALDRRDEAAARRAMDDTLSHASRIVTELGVRAPTS